MESQVIGRFAPSPTGNMHAGNIFAALNAWLIAKSQGGKILMRIEDLDAERSKAEYADKILRDFERLGLSWDIGPVYQSNRAQAYQEAFLELNIKAEIYPCFCSRADLRAQSAPHDGEHFVYQGNCRSLNAQERLEATFELAASGRKPAYRICVHDKDIVLNDTFYGVFSHNLARDVGDFVLKRSDGGFAYQLAVVLDDAEYGVNSVVRGHDLLYSAPQQAYLCELLGFKVPEYAHIPLLCADDGRRLSKRDADTEIDVLLAEYGSPEAVLGHIAFIGGLQDEDLPASASDLLEQFNMAECAKAYSGKPSIVYR